MKISSTRKLLLLGVTVAAGVVMPSMASAASWSLVGTTHQLFSPNLSFTAHTSPLPGVIEWSCNGAEFDVDVASASTLTITSTRFNGCMGTAAGTPCNVTLAGTGFPWTATATATDNVQVHNVSIDVLLENTPGAATCVANGGKALITGTLTGGSWSPVDNTTNLVNETGLTTHYVVPGFTFFSSTTATGIIRDTAGTLRMFM